MNYISTRMLVHVTSLDRTLIQRNCIAVVANKTIKVVKVPYLVAHRKNKGEQGLHRAFMIYRQGGYQCL